MAKPKDTEIKRVGRFGLVGIMNTVIDFVAFNVLRLAIPVTIASVISGTLAMINSYIFNQRFTFKAKKVEPKQTVIFFVATIFGIYVIRPAVIYFFTKVWLGPVHLGYSITHAIGLPFSQKFVADNAAWLAAIVIVLVYNYYAYKKWVFVK